MNFWILRWGRFLWTVLESKVYLSTKSLGVHDVPLIANLFCPPLSEHCTSSLRATNKRYVASGPRRGVSRPIRRTTLPPAVSAARPSLQMAVATSAPTARPNSALAVEAGSLCAPIMWENWPSSCPLFISPHPCYSWCTVQSFCFCVFVNVCLFWLPGHTLVSPKCTGRVDWHHS